MRNHSLMRPLVAAALTTTALGLAACGGDAASGDTAADRDEQARDAELAFARCMREHGIDVPDPQPGQRGIRLAAPEGVSPAKMDEANEACQKYLEDIKGPELSPEQQKEFQEAALAHARCMREHGIDMPDPTFGSNGEAKIRIQGGKGGKGGPDPDDPKFQEAQEACESLMPKLRGEGPSTQESSP